MTQYVRMKYRWRLTASGLVNPPATVVIRNSPNAINKGATYKLSNRWLEWIHKNNGYQEARYLLKEHSGWVNKWAGDGTPIAEAVDLGGNVREVERIEGNFAKLVSLLPNDLTPEKDNYLLVGKFTSVTPTNEPRLAGPGLHVYYPFVINGEAWVSLDWVDLFSYKPEPLWPGGAPADLSGYAAVILKGTVVRQQPEGVKIYVVSSDTIVRVISEVNGWAKIGDKRWVTIASVRSI